MVNTYSAGELLRKMCVTGSAAAVGNRKSLPVWRELLINCFLINSSDIRQLPIHIELTAVKE